MIAWVSILAKNTPQYTETQNRKEYLSNGPMGVFEWNQAAGTLEIAQCLTDIDGYTVIGGGDSVAAIKHPTLLIALIMYPLVVVHLLHSWKEKITWLKALRRK